MNAEAHAAIERAADETPIDVQPIRIAVDLDHDSALAGLLEHPVEIHRVARPRQQLPAGEVAEESDGWVIERAEDALSHLILLHPESRMDRSDHEVESRERLVVV